MIQWPFPLMCRWMAGAALSCYRTPQPSLWKNQWSLRNVTWRWLITLPFRGNWSAGDQLVRHVEASWLDRYAHDRILEAYPIPLLSMFWPRNSFHPKLHSSNSHVPGTQDWWPSWPVLVELQSLGLCILHPQIYHLPTCCPTCPTCSAQQRNHSAARNKLRGKKMEPTGSQSVNCRNHY